MYWFNLAQEKNNKQAVINHGNEILGYVKREIILTQGDTISL
jgi:hypothetical protein